MSKGTGFVEFATPADASTAVNKLSGYEFSGRPMTLKFAGSYSASRGGYGGASSSSGTGYQKQY